MNETNAPNCERRDELLEFLYGELADSEAKRFQSHLRECTACSEELNDFSGVRQSVIAWRHETLGAIPTSSTVLHDKRSALAALRAFFDFSPLWLKGAVGVAAMLFVVLIGLSLRNLQRSNPPHDVMIVPAPAASNQAQINAEVERRVKEELASKEQKTPSITVASPVQPAIVKNRRKVISNNPLEVAQRPLSRSERAELAADLRLVSHRDSEDLLDDGINR
jgi:hypothetical protein